MSRLFRGVSTLAVAAWAGLGFGALPRVEAQESCHDCLEMGAEWCPPGQHRVQCWDYLPYGYNGCNDGETWVWNGADFVKECWCSTIPYAFCDMRS
jgi:hypothetical protein